MLDYGLWCMLRTRMWRAAFFRELIVSKAIGIGAGWVWWKLYQYWGKRHLIYSWEEPKESDNIA